MALRPVHATIGDQIMGFISMPGSHPLASLTDHSLPTGGCQQRETRYLAMWPQYCNDLARRLLSKGDVPLRFLARKPMDRAPEEASCP